MKQSNHKTLTIDFRMHKAAGIGSYLQNIIPFILDKFKISLLGKTKEIQEYPWGSSVDVIECDSKIYSLKEQWALFIKIPSCDLFWSPHYNVPLLPIKAKKKIVTIHDVFHLVSYQNLSLNQKIYAKIVMGQAIKKSDFIFTVSNFSKNEIKKYTKTLKDIEILYNAVDFKQFKTIENVDLLKKIKLKYKLPEKFILFVGSVKPHKNLKNLILAIKNIDINLVIVGKKTGFITGDPHLFELIDDLGLKHKVFFTGYVLKQDIAAIYNLAKLFAFPSLYEGFGIPPLEAQACGCPVVCSNKASLPEIYGDSVIYFDPLNVDQITKKIKQVLDNKTLRDNLIQKGFENIKRFGWEQSAQKFVQIIESG